MKHTITSIGYVGIKFCYLDIPEDECIRRYEKNEGDTAVNIETFEFEDEFYAYEVWQ